MVNREDQLVTTNENVMFIVDEEHNLSGVKKDIGKVLVPNRDESKVTVFTVNKQVKVHEKNCHIQLEKQEGYVTLRKRYGKNIQKQEGQENQTENKQKRK